VPQSSKIWQCTAIGQREKEDAQWISSGKSWFTEYLGISPNPREAYPRVLALTFPPLPEGFKPEDPLTSRHGDALEPVGAEPKLLLQVVNDQALFWGGGFAKKAGKKWRSAQSQFRQWAYDHRNLKLGNIHAVKVQPDLTLVSLVAQRGFRGPSSGPRLRYTALFSALEKVAELAKTQSATVHMPRIGTGEAGGSWNLIEGIIRETLISRGIKVRIYLHSHRQDSPTQPSFEFPQHMADEVF
jgi:O-acetyl-ADP-ribose deacetylase (regulator of RNase III)